MSWPVFKEYLQPYLFFEFLKPDFIYNFSEPFRLSITFVKINYLFYKVKHLLLGKVLCHQIPKSWTRPCASSNS